MTQIATCPSALVWLQAPLRSACRWVYARKPFLTAFKAAAHTLGWRRDTRTSPDSSRARFIPLFLSPRFGGLSRVVRKRGQLSIGVHYRWAVAFVMLIR